VLERYDRQIAIIGEEAQNKILNAKVLVIGAGALGTSILNSLVRAGVGFIRVADMDVVELSNLQRQMLFDEMDLGEKKVIAAVNKLKLINSQVKLEPIFDKITSDTIGKYAIGCDIIIDATDNFSTREIINEYAVKNNLPWIYGGVAAAFGMAKTIIPKETACLKCFMRKKTNEEYTARNSGIINGITAVIGAIEANMALRYIIGKPSTKLIYIDLFEDDFQTIEVKRDINCPVCGGEKND
jgi:adenylyltransferase/sulfurtransferase